MYRYTDNNLNTAMSFPNFLQADRLSHVESLEGRPLTCARQFQDTDMLWLWSARLVHNDNAEDHIYDSDDE